MHRFIPRIARCLVLCGYGCLVSTALAGTPSTAGSSCVVGSIHVPQSQTRIEASKVEVALLADPTTYNLDLQVRLEDDSVVLAGQVSCEQVRQRALEVARQSCYLPVRDGLSVPPPKTVQRVGAHALQGKARDALIRKLGIQADHVQVVADAAGVVTLNGEVASLEDKLTASRSLRGLEGCTQVVNSLNVSSAAPAAQSIAVISSDGQSVACNHAEPAPQEARPATLPSAEPAAPATLPSGLPANRLVTASNLPPGHTAPHSVMYVVPTSGYAVVAPGPTMGSYGYPGPTLQPRTYPYEPQVSHRPSFRDRLCAWRQARSSRNCAAPGPQVIQPQAPHMVTTAEPPAPAPAPAVQPIPATPATPAPVLAPEMPVTTAQPLPMQTSQAPTTAWPPAHATRPATAGSGNATFQSRPLAGLLERQGTRPMAPSQAPIPQPAPVQAPVSPAPVAMQQPLQPTAALQQAPVQPVVVQPAVVRPATAQPVPAAARAVAVQGVPLVVAQEQIRMTSKELVQRIQKMCGKLVREVRIESGPEGTVIVHVQSMPASEHLLVARLMQMQELSASNVRLNVHMSK